MSEAYAVGRSDASHARSHESGTKAQRPARARGESLLQLLDALEFFPQLVGQHEIEPRGSYYAMHMSDMTDTCVASCPGRLFKIQCNFVASCRLKNHQVGKTPKTVGEYPDAATLKAIPRELFEMPQTKCSKAYRSLHLSLPRSATRFSDPRRNATRPRISHAEAPRRD